MYRRVRFNTGKTRYQIKILLLVATEEEGGIDPSARYSVSRSCPSVEKYSHLIAGPTTEFRSKDLPADTPPIAQTRINRQEVV